MRAIKRIAILHLVKWPGRRFFLLPPSWKVFEAITSIVRSGIWLCFGLWFWKLRGTNRPHYRKNRLSRLWTAFSTDWINSGFDWWVGGLNERRCRGFGKGGTVFGKARQWWHQLTVRHSVSRVSPSRARSSSIHDDGELWLSLLVNQYPTASSRIIDTKFSFARVICSNNCERIFHVIWLFIDCTRPGDGASKSACRRHWLIPMFFQTNSLEHMNRGLFDGEFSRNPIILCLNRVWRVFLAEVYFHFECRYHAIFESNIIFPLQIGCLS